MLAGDHRRRRSESLLLNCRARSADLRFSRLTCDCRPSHLLRPLLLVFSRCLTSSARWMWSTVQSHFLHPLLNLVTSILLLIIATIVVKIIIRLSHIVSPRIIIVALKEMKSSGLISRVYSENFRLSRQRRREKRNIGDELEVKRRKLKFENMRNEMKITGWTCEVNVRQMWNVWRVKCSIIAGTCCIKWATLKTLESRVESPTKERRFL